MTTFASCLREDTEDGPSEESESKTRCEFKKSMFNLKKKGTKENGK